MKSQGTKTFAYAALIAALVMGAGQATATDSGLIPIDTAPLILPSPANSGSVMTFSVNFTAQAQADLSAAEQAFFTDGLDFWDDIIIGHRDGVSRSWELTVDTFSQAASGGGVVLGSAGPNGLTFSGVVAGSGLGSGSEFANDTDRFLLSTGGNANFNVHPDAGALNPLTIRHEIGHALGIGTLWEDNEVYNDGNGATGNRTLAGGTPGQYEGAAALAAFQTEFDPTATFVQVELDGGGGTANGHWNEVLDNFGTENSPGFDGDPGDGAPAPVVIDPTSAFFGESLDNELMTGVLSNPAFLSNTSIQSLYDIGFTVVPEPSSLALLGLGGFLLIRRRRRG